MDGLICGRYRVTGKLGAGGMAEVFIAKHELIEQEAAVKLLHPQMSAHKSVVKRFLQEAQAAAAIKHPGIVGIYDVGYTADGRAYIVMERLHGETLNERLQRVGRLSMEEASLLMRQLAGVMDAAHSRKIIHRDLKPDNIFIVPDPEVSSGERIKVLDFGLAKLAEEYGGSLVTAKGMVFGTPSYMAPEQCKDAGTVDERADLYSIGCIFYRCLCGEPPFSMSEPLAILRAQISDMPEPPVRRRPDVPPEIDRLIMRLLEKSPEARVQTCAELVAALGSTAADATLVDVGAGASAMQGGGEAAAGHGGHGADSQEEATLVDIGGAQGAGEARPPGPGWPPAARPVQVPQAGSAGSAPSVNAGELRGHGRRAGTRRAPTRRIWPIVAAGVAFVLVGIAGGALWVRSGQHDEPPAVAAEPAQSAAPTAESESDAAFAGHLEQARQALQNREWEQALAALDEAASVGVDDPDLEEQARELRASATEGERDQARFQGLQEALGAGDIDAVLERFAEISPESVYRDDAARAMGEARESLLSKIEERADEMAGDRACDDLAAWLDELEPLVPGARERARRALAECARPAARARKAKKPERAAEPAFSAEEVQALIKATKAAYLRNDYAQASASCRKVLEADPDHGEANQWCALSACRQKNVRRARRYYQRLNSARKSAVHQICFTQERINLAAE